MDRFIAGAGYYVVAVVAFAGVLDPEDRPGSSLWMGFLTLGSAVAWTLLVRGDEIRRDVKRAGRPVPRWRAALRARMGWLRWLLAVGYAAASAWYSQANYDTAWFTVLAVVVMFSVITYATRPLPPVGAPRDAGDDRGQLLRA